MEISPVCETMQERVVYDIMLNSLNVRLFGNWSDVVIAYIAALISKVVYLEIVCLSKITSVLTHYKCQRSEGIH